MCHGLFHLKSLRLEASVRFQILANISLLDDGCVELDWDVPLETVLIILQLVAKRLDHWPCSYRFEIWILISIFSLCVQRSRPWEHRKLVVGLYAKILVLFRLRRWVSFLSASLAFQWEPEGFHWCPLFLHLRQITSQGARLFVKVFYCGCKSSSRMNFRQRQWLSSSL